MKETLEKLIIAFAILCKHAPLHGVDFIDAVKNSAPIVADTIIELFKDKEKK